MVILTIILLLSGCIYSPQASDTSPATNIPPTPRAGTFTSPHNPIDMEKLNNSLSNDSFLVDK